MIDNDWLTHNEVMAIVRLRRTTLYKYRRAGTFPAGFKIGGRQMWSDR